MGMFDALKGQSEVRLTPKAAMLLACISMTAADGYIDEDEIAVIRRLDGPHITKDWELALKAWRQSSSSMDCVEKIRGILNREQRDCTLANLVEIAMADGELEGNEKQLLEAYSQVLEVSSDFAAEVVGVMAIKNNHSIF